MDESSTAVPLGPLPAVWPDLVTRTPRYSPHAAVCCSLSGPSTVHLPLTARTSTDGATATAAAAADARSRPTRTGRSLDSTLPSPSCCQC